MNKEEVLTQLNDLLYNFKNYKKVDSTKDDVQTLEYVIKELERTAQEVPTQNLEMVCKPVVEHLRNNYDPYCTIVISDTQIRLVRDEIGIPVKSND